MNRKVIIKWLKPVLLFYSVFLLFNLCSIIGRTTSTTYTITIYADNDPPGQNSLSAPGPSLLSGSANELGFPVNAGDTVTIDAGTNNTNNNGIVLSPETPAEVAVPQNVRFDPDGFSITGVTLAWPGAKMGRLMTRNKEDMSWINVGTGPVEITLGGYSGTENGMTLEFYVNDEKNKYDDNRDVNGYYWVKVVVTPPYIDVQIPGSVKLALGGDRPSGSVSPPYNWSLSKKRKNMLRKLIEYRITKEAIVVIK